MKDIAKRGIRKVHVWSYVIYFVCIFLGGLVVGLGVGSMMTSIKENKNIELSSYFFIVVGAIVIVIGFIALILLAVMHDKNRKNPHPYLINYDEKNKEFIFYPLKEKEIKLPKDEIFTLLCSLNGNNQTVLVYKDQKINLGFTKDSLEVINNEIMACKQ